MNQFLSDIAGRVHLLPIHGVQFQALESDGAPYDYNLGIYNVEAESSFSYEPIKRPTDRGNFKVLGYKFKATIYFMDTLILSSLKGILDTYFSDYYDFKIALGTAVLYGDEAHENPTNINSTTEAQIFISKSNSELSHSFVIDQLELRERGKLEIEGFLKNLHFSI